MSEINECSATENHSQAPDVGCSRKAVSSDTMYIHYLGHAGFLLETKRMIVLMDPWLSPSGAFDSAWFQLPRNHHLAAFVQESMNDSTRDRFIYISHEHKDHYDPSFLRSLSTRDFTFIIPRFRRDSLTAVIEQIGARDVISCVNGSSIDLPDGSITLYTDDTEINRDSAALIRAGNNSFLNLNDCKIFDGLPAIMRSHEKIDVFSCQFSGATWHPTCYEYPRDEYERLAKKRYLAKFESVARAIVTVNPQLYIPSAGPACFLDPDLMHLNFEHVNIFPRAPRFLEYLTKRLKQAPVRFSELMPGDGVDVATMRVDAQTTERMTNENFEQSVRTYAESYAGLFAARRRVAEMEEGDAIVERLAAVLREKLLRFHLAGRITHTLYVSLENTNKKVRVDFQRGQVNLVTEMNKDFSYCFSSRAGEIARVLDGKISWGDFLLTFRFGMSRNPDVYETLVHGFLVLDSEDLDPFCAKVLALESNNERIHVIAGGATYAINRYCPHSGADLGTAAVEDDRYLVCPRHAWRFDLEQQGNCVSNETTIKAVCLEDCLGEWSNPSQSERLEGIRRNEFRGDARDKEGREPSPLVSAR
jgi:UDP-MurNAc hydroxylase